MAKRGRPKGSKNVSGFAAIAREFAKSQHKGRGRGRPKGSGIQRHPTRAHMAEQSYKEGAYMDIATRRLLHRRGRKAGHKGTKSKGMIPLASLKGRKLLIHVIDEA